MLILPMWRSAWWDAPLLVAVYTFALLFVLSLIFHQQTVPVYTFFTIYATDKLDACKVTLQEEVCDD